MTRLYRLLHLIAQDNDINIKPLDKIDWSNPLITDYGLDHLKRAASRLPLKHFETFANGEHTDVLKLIHKYRLHFLHSFLNDAFDNNPELHNQIYERQ